jgi:hypothetical protein
MSGSYRWGLTATATLEDLLNDHARQPPTIAATPYRPDWLCCTQDLYRTESTEWCLRALQWGPTPLQALQHFSFFLLIADGQPLIARLNVTP